MKIKTTVIGAYPKIGDGLDAQELRRALHKRDRDEIGDADLSKVFDEVTRGAIGEIEAAGVDLTNDGQIRWDDLLSPFARAWSGVEPGPLERFYDNNTYFRQPVIDGRIETDGRSLVRDYKFAKGIAKAELKAAIPGPLTFATLAARDDQYRSLEERVLAVADATAKEIAGLKAAGASMIDIEDPAVVASPKHIELAREAYRRLADAEVALSLETFFFAADAVLESLASFPLASVGIDVRSRDTTAYDRLDAFRTQNVVLGVVDARNTRLETAEEVARYAERALKLVPPERLVLATTTSLEYLPRDVARAKLAALVEGARLASGEAAGAGAPGAGAPDGVGAPGGGASA
jgi:5-methyltetrahydropteroyltriglutamate--homocysteine methyltransferase